MIWRSTSRWYKLWFIIFATQGTLRTMDGNG